MENKSRRRFLKEDALLWGTAGVVAGIGLDEIVRWYLGQSTNKPKVSTLATAQAVPIEKDFITVTASPISVVSDDKLDQQPTVVTVQPSDVPIEKDFITVTASPISVVSDDKLDQQPTVVTVQPSDVPKVRDTPKVEVVTEAKPFVLSVDTMKVSRDGAKNSNVKIEELTAKVAETGATHIAIGTPYDQEFWPVMKKWVESARRNNLKVWFRGNACGWEGWFDHSVMQKPEDQHGIVRTFIAGNKGLFEDNDIFTPCPEPENTKVPSLQNYWNGHQVSLQTFVIDSYKNAKTALAAAGIKGVVPGYFSMNGDVARDMPQGVVNAMGGVVAIDHYVSNPADMGGWIQTLVNKYSEDTKIVIGEFGAPIPDLNGDMTEEQQAKFVTELFAAMLRFKQVTGINYWGIYDGSTALLNPNMTDRMVYKVVKSTYTKLRG